MIPFLTAVPGLLRQAPVPALSAEGAFEVFSAAAPEGWRVELIEGDIHVTPPADGEHEEIVSELSGQVRDHRKDLGRCTGIGLFVPGASKTGKVEPDLVLAPKGGFADQEEYHDASPVLMVAEVASPSTGDNDRRKSSPVTPVPASPSICSSTARRVRSSTRSRRATSTPAQCRTSRPRWCPFPNRSASTWTPGSSEPGGASDKNGGSHQEVRITALAQPVEEGVVRQAAGGGDFPHGGGGPRLGRKAVCRPPEARRPPGDGVQETAFRR